VFCTSMYETYHTERMWNWVCKKYLNYVRFVRMYICMFCMYVMFVRIICAMILLCNGYVTMYLCLYVCT
jgi:hypothetical protein